MLCCPEDKLCPIEKKGGSEQKLHPKFCCSSCELPVCDECMTGMRAEGDTLAMPTAALANDMMIYYAPRELYEDKVTMLEMICASVCITSMICFTLEKKNRGERAFDVETGMNRHRLGARGNATSFPLPWHDLLQQFKSEEQGEYAGTSDLPHTGEELSNFVSVILKTHNDEEVDDRSSVSYTHLRAHET